MQRKVSIIGILSLINKYGSLLQITRNLEKLTMSVFLHAAKEENQVNALYLECKTKELFGIVDVTGNLKSKIWQRGRSDRNLYSIGQGSSS